MSLATSSFSRAVQSLALAACFSLTGAMAQTSAPAAVEPPPLTDFFKSPVYSEMRLSPNGRYVATTTELHGRLNLIVLDLNERTSKPLTSYNNIDVGNLRWAGDDYVIFSAIALNSPSGQEGPRSGGLFSAARDGSSVFQLAKTASQHRKSGNAGGGFVQLSYQRMVPGSKDEMIAEGIVAGDDSVDLYRVNLTNGRNRILTQGRPSDRLQRWILDSKMVPRVAIAGGKGSSTEAVIFYRANAEAPWAEIARFDVTKPPAFVPLGFDKDDLTLYVATNANRSNMAIYLYNPQTKQLGEQIAQHPQYDLGASPQGEAFGSLIPGAQGGGLAGIRIDSDRPQVVWLDEKMARIQKTLDESLRGRINAVQPSASSRYLVNSYSDTQAGSYFLYDDDKRRLEELSPVRPWLDGKLAQVRPFMLKTRDGLQIPSYYVLPQGHQVGAKLPTVIHIHGGPHARDVVNGGRFGGSFGVMEAQLLASRGYAVVLPNFRITPGIGSSIYYAGFGAFGGAMSEDHEDAAKWAVDQGFADPKRMCISGASYGGYAALQALVRPSNPFACSISGLPVTDLKFQMAESDIADAPQALEYWRKITGVKAFDDASAREMSPLNSAAKIKTPVFMYVGDEDTRTPPKQAERMAEALKAAGNPVKDYFVGKGEGHGYGVRATNVALYERMLKFLEASIGK